MPLSGPAHPTTLPAWGRLAAAELPSSVLALMAELDDSTWPLLAVNPRSDTAVLSRVRSGGTRPVIARQVGLAHLWGPCADPDELADQATRPLADRHQLALSNPLLPDAVRRDAVDATHDARTAVHLLDNPRLSAQEAAELLRRWRRLAGPPVSVSLSDVAVRLLGRHPDLAVDVLRHLPSGAIPVAQVPGGLELLRRRDRRLPQVEEIIALQQDAAPGEADPLLVAARAGDVAATTASRLTSREQVALAAGASCPVDPFVHGRACDGGHVNPWMATDPFTRRRLSWVARFTDAPDRRALWAAWHGPHSTACDEVQHEPLEQCVEALAPLGEDPDAWHIALRLMDQWDGTLAELAEAAAHLVD